MTLETRRPIKHRINFLLPAASLFLLHLLPVPPAVAEIREGTAPVALEIDNSTSQLYVAEKNAKQIAVLDLNTKKISETLPLPENPTGMTLDKNGQKIYVTAGGPGGTVSLLDVKSKKIVSSVAVGHTPMSPVLSPDGTSLYVCNRFDGNISVIDTAEMREKARIPVIREPIAAAVTPDGKTLAVANHLPSGAADRGYIASAVSIIDTAAQKRLADISLTNGSTGMQGICISPDGKYAYATHIMARYHVPTTQLERGWMNTNAVSVIDIPQMKSVNTVLLDSVDLGAANPWAIECTEDGKYLCVTHAGTHELSLIDRNALHKRLTDAAAGKKVTSVSDSADHVPNDLSFMVNIRKRIKLRGNGPRSLAILGKTAYVGEFFSDSVSVVDLENKARGLPPSIPLDDTQEMSAVRRGEMYFHDADLCFQHWQSCSSCHPDARTDGLNWDLLNDGMGNPKQTKSLLLSHVTPPVMITGIRPDAETAVRAGIRYIQFAVRPEEDAVCIDKYLKSLKPVPSPFLQDGKLTDSAKRGKEIFEQSGCAMCHTASTNHTDGQTHDLDLGIGLDADVSFDTPTLRENWRTAPFLYDGRAASIKDLLTKHNTEDTHGSTSNLTGEEIKDLNEYLLSL